MKLVSIALYSLGGICLLFGLLSGTLVDGAGTDGAIFGTRLLLEGNAATFAKVGSITVIAGWCSEFVRLSAELSRKL